MTSYMNSNRALKAVQNHIFARVYHMITKAKRNPEERTNACEINGIHGVTRRRETQRQGCGCKLGVKLVLACTSGICFCSLTVHTTYCAQLVKMQLSLSL